MITTIATFSWVAALVSGVLMAAGTVLAVRLRGASRIGVADVLVGAVVGAGSLVASWLLANRLLGMGTFGGISVAYLFLVLGVPLAGLLVLAHGWWAARGHRRGDPTATPLTRPARATCAVALVLAPLGIYATYVEPAMLDVDRPEPVVVAAARDGDDPFTIGVLTDLQTPVVGERERRAVDELLAAHPDVIVLPGDIIQADDKTFDAQLPALRELFGRLSAPGGVFLVAGDVDKPDTRLTRMVEGTQVRYLDHEVVTASVGDRSLTIGGIGPDYRSPPARAVIDQLESAPGDGDIRILLSHRPDPVLDLGDDSRVDLQVSGHTHGGQVAVPFLGPLMTLSNVPRAIAAGGLHDLGGNEIYVGRGVGLERGQAPQVRFGARPNIGVVTIQG